MKLRVNRVHIRYEDDYFNADSPFSFGLVIDVSHPKSYIFRNLYGIIVATSPIGLIRMAKSFK